MEGRGAAQACMHLEDIKSEQVGLQQGRPHVTKQGERLCRQDAWIGIAWSRSHQESLGHLATVTCNDGEMFEQTAQRLGFQPHNEQKGNEQKGQSMAAGTATAALAPQVCQWGP